MGNISPVRFRIEELFGEYNVDLPLDNDVNIFLGENGMGKTTILSCLYYILSGKIEQLANLHFRTIMVDFSDGSNHSLLKDDLVAYAENFTTSNGTNFYNIIDKNDLVILKEDMLSRNYLESSLLRKYTIRISESYRVPLHIARRELVQYLKLHSGSSKNNGCSENARTFQKNIQNILKNSLLYFPTYRRIEENTSELGLDLEYNSRNSVKDKLIQFGMSDVDATIKNILESIKTIAIDGFTHMTGLLLKQYLNEKSINTSSTKIDIDILSITLDRIGKQIDTSDKEQILAIAKSDKIYAPENLHLHNLINQLIDSYKQQDQYDKQVRKFVSVCNEYLTTKKYYYDESKVNLNIFRTTESGELDYTRVLKTQNLSSGEKQIISVFSKLYLEKTTPHIILFDEPELSLSIQWQEKFLPDIMSSENCAKLIAVTHSPFIFDNVFDEFAQDMRDYITLYRG